MPPETTPQADWLMQGRLYTRAEVLARPSPVPRSAGVYAWWFHGLPNVPTTGCIERDGWHLLYVGISPRQPSAADQSGTNGLYYRIRNHYQGNAEGSTLRLSLGCLLGLGLRRVGSGTRMTFSAGEATLSEWMAGHARVCWLACADPWRVEETLIREISLPLNLDQNRTHAFHMSLATLRRDTKTTARTLSIVPK